MQSQVLSERHRLLVEAVVDLFLAPANQQAVLTRDQFYEQFSGRVASTPRLRLYWSFSRDADGKTQSDELQEDLRHLHHRGYVFLSRNPHIVPTHKALMALGRHPVWR